MTGRMGSLIGRRPCWVCARVPGRAPASAVAVWTARPSRNRMALCSPCLDCWLDNADEEPDLEAIALDWIKPIGARS